MNDLEFLKRLAQMDMDVKTADAMIGESIANGSSFNKMVIIHDLLSKATCASLALQHSLLTKQNANPPTAAVD